MYSYDEVFKASVEYFGGNELSAKVFVDKYALQDNDGNYLELTPDDMHRRIAKELARIEKKKFRNPLPEEEIFQRLRYFKEIIPQGSPMYGIGNPYQVSSLSNCYVIDSPNDSYGGIMRADQEIAQISKRRGGIGVDISNLRPKDSSVNNAAKTTSGAITFMERFSNTLREVGQCISWDQRVLTDKGLVNICDVDPKIHKVWTRIGWVDVLNKIQSGIKEVFEITTKSGYTLRCTEDHILSVGNLEEKRVSDLSTGDYLNIIPGTTNFTKQYVTLSEVQYTLDSKNNSNRLKTYQLPEILDEDLAYLLGYCYGNGSVEKQKNGKASCISIAIPDDQLEISRKIKRIINSTFGYSSNKLNSDGKCHHYHICSRYVSEFLDQNSLLKEKATTIVFPEKIKESPPTVIASFISGLIDADGSVVQSKKNIKLSLTALDFIKECQTQLMALGVLTTINVQPRNNKPNWSPLYTLSINGQANQSLAKSVLKDSVKILQANWSKRMEYWSTPFYPRDLNVSGISALKFNNSNQRLSLSTYSKTQKALNVCLPNPIIQDKIKSIKSIGLEETYDIQLSEEHLFWCEGFLVHNCGRRGAGMISISVHHPDVLDFINVKRDLGRVTGANISVRLSDEFLRAVSFDAEYELRFPVDSTTPNISKNVLAKEVWSSIIDSAHAMAEPGLLFWDSIVNSSPADCYKNFGYRTLSTNPCGEVPLSPHDSCRLLSINLFSCIDNPYTKDARINKKKLWDSAYFAQRMMDNIVDLELECVDRILSKIEQDPEPSEDKQCEINLWTKIKKACENGRRTGTGTTALGDTLAAINVKFCSDESIDITDQIYETIALACYTCSVDMAEEIGPFPVWDRELEKDNPYLLRIRDKDPALWNRMKRVGRRNIALLTNAPTGSISIEACVEVNKVRYHNTTSGIEALFMQSFTRRKKGNPGDKNFRTDFVDQSGDHWMEFKVYHEPIKAWHSINSEKNIDENPYHGCCAQDIDWVKRVRMQATIQKHIDHSISTTINLPEDVSKEEVAKIYLEAWKSGCKGITVYRDNCRTGVLVSNDKKNETKLQKTEAPKRPKTLPCSVHHITVKGTPYFVLIGLLDDEPYEVFAGQNKKAIAPSIKFGKITKKTRGKYHAEFDDGSELSPITAFIDDEEETITRLVSTSLRHGTDIAFLVHQLEKSSGDMQSFSKCIARALKKQIKNGTKVHGEECPECSGELVREEGCINCKSCGYSKCK